MWGVYIMECRVCGNKHVGVAETDGELDNCECAKCGHMTCEAVDPNEEAETWNGQS
jgi:Zn ribbon nucleic-acid-binding protein